MIQKFSFFSLFGMLILLIPTTMNSQTYDSNEPLAHTYSIVARDAKTGEMAVAVQSHWFSVGTIVSWGESGVGVVATQSFVNPAFGPEGLALMKAGVPAEEALLQLIHKDEGRDFRQVAMINAEGQVSAYTGKKCIDYASHFVGENFSVQANMMLNNKVVPAMTQAYEENAELPLAERVVAAMKAAQIAGGDIRGKQSAVLLVVDGTPAEYAWKDKLIDLRVDDHENPIEELDRLLSVHRAYEFMNLGDVAVEQGNMEKAMEYYRNAQKLFPENLEMQYWTAVAMANNNQLTEALPIFKKVFLADPNWKELTKRLPKSELLNVREEDLQKILNSGSK